MSLVNSPFFLASSGATVDEGQSLRFNLDDDPYLQWTPPTVGSSLTQTLSFWMKRTADGNYIFRANQFYIYLIGDNLNYYDFRQGGNGLILVTNAVYRDTSAWMHVVLTQDRSNATASNRIKLYVNGEQITSFSTATYPNQNEGSYFNNSGNTHYISHPSNNQYDGYLANVTFIDGQALDPTSFGEYDDTLWKPKSDTDIQALTFGDNGFYLPFKQTTKAEGFSTVTYTGNGGTQSIEGVGFEPDFVWVKKRNASENHELVDSVRGAPKRLQSNVTNAENTGGFTSFDSSGFTLSGGYGTDNENGSSYVAWAWNAGDNLASTGFSSVTWTGNDVNGRNITGLGFSPDLVWIKNRDVAENHNLYDTIRGAGQQLYPDTADAEVDRGNLGLQSFDSDGFSLGTGGEVNDANEDYVAWAWDAGTGSAASNTDGTITSSVKADTAKGFSIATYTGNATDGATIGHGLSQSPDMIIVKDRTNSASWRVMHKDIDYTNDTLYLDQTYAETADDRVKDFNSTTFTVTGGGGVNGSSRDHVAYCFHGVSGYSKFDSYSGTGSSGNAITGLGFRPAFVMIKRTDNSGHWNIYDSTRSPVNPANKVLLANSSNTEASGSAFDIDFDSDGFTINNTDTDRNASGSTYIYMAFAGGQDLISPLNTNGSIDSRVKANITNGFSIATYSGNGTAGASIGHGLSSAPEMVIVKDRTATGFWAVYHSGVDATAPEDYLMRLNTTDDRLNGSVYWNDTAPTSSVFTVGTSSAVNNSSRDYVAYCFHSVSGYSSIGSYTGNGSATGPTVTTGFKPAFVLIKSSTAATGWAIVDNTRSPTNPTTKTLFPDLSNAEYTSTSSSDHYVDLNSNGFQIKNTNSRFNANGETFIYMAFADTRDATFFGDTSGKGNNWTPNNLNNTDVVPDSPVSGGNFAVLNSLNLSQGTLSEGNLRISSTSSNRGFTTGTFKAQGKLYFEVRKSGGQGGFVGIGDTSNSNHQSIDLYDGTPRIDGSAGSALGAFSTGDICGVAVDIDTKNIEFFKNGLSIYTATYTTDVEYFPYFYDSSGGRTMDNIANFGQDSSFAGNEIPQGNTDDNGVGDFYYAPPSGFLALNTSNLPTPNITLPDEYFNTVLYTGTGTTRSVTGVGFQPDWLWTKARNNASNNNLIDVVRGTNKLLLSDLADAEYTQTIIDSFDSDGFTTSSAASGINLNGYTYAAWNWKAGGTAVSNTDGSINSQVSANQDAGFSIVSYTGNGVNSTVGHGLSSAPEMVIVKSRSLATSWPVYHTGLTSASYRVFLDVTNAEGSSLEWNSTDPTSSVFSIGPTGYSVNNSGATYIAYCLHSVEGYSKFGSYTGNGSTDGTFVHCGFRPAWIMFKRINSTSNWIIQDAERNQFNVVDKWLDASGTSAEGTLGFLDFTANGFKHRYTSGTWNASGSTYIFMAFAEAPFKSANAR